MLLPALTVEHRVTSSGDANVWIAPRESGGTALVLHFTDTNGKGYAVCLTADDLARIHASATNVIAATPADIDHWLDQAAGHIKQLIGQSQ